MGTFGIFHDITIFFRAITDLSSKKFKEHEIRSHDESCPFMQMKSEAITNTESEIMLYN